MAEVVDVRGAVVGRSVRPVPHTTRSGRVRRALDAAVAEACDQSTVPVVLAVVSAADPVDRESGRLIHLPDAPFLVGDLDPVSVLRPRVSGPVIVDNDVNWAARAESAAAGPGSSTTSPTSISARASDAPSSATGRFAAATMG